VRRGHSHLSRLLGNLKIGALSESGGTEQRKDEAKPLPKTGMSNA